MSTLDNQKGITCNAVASSDSKNKQKIICNPVTSTLDSRPLQQTVYTMTSTYSLQYIPGGQKTNTNRCHTSTLDQFKNSFISTQSSKLRRSLKIKARHHTRCKSTALETDIKFHNFLGNRDINNGPAE